MLEPDALAGQRTKECPACKSQVPAGASVCRYCRHSFYAGRKALAVGAGLGIIALAYFGLDYAPQPAPEPASSPPAPAAAPSPIDAGSDKAPSSSDPKVNALLLSEARLDEACRGENVTPDSAVCVRRDQATERLYQAGWCYSEPGGSAADREWHECVAVETAPISERHRKWISDCQDATLGDLNDPRSADFPNPAVNPSAFMHAQPLQTVKGPNPLKVSPAALIKWMDDHPELSSEEVAFKFYAKNVMGGVQRYTAICTFQDNFDGTTKLVKHVISAD